jgi:hypothetical protein
MSGLFHQRVFVCEADSDCMFYNVLLDLPEIHGEQQPDALFIHAGGKDRTAVLAEALRALGVTVDVIVDIDVLNSEPLLQRIVTALGGNFATVAAEVRPLKTAIEEHKPWLNASEVAKGIRAILDNAPPSGEFPRPLREEIVKIFRKASPWDALKEAGEAAIPAGQPTLHWQALKKKCAELGLWIVPVGQLEGFCKSIGGHGPRWVQHVIERGDLATNAELAPARQFIKAVWNRISPD